MKSQVLKLSQNQIVALFANYKELEQQYDHLQTSYQQREARVMELVDENIQLKH